MDELLSFIERGTASFFTTARSKARRLSISRATCQEGDEETKEEFKLTNTHFNRISTCLKIIYKPYGISQSLLFDLGGDSEIEGQQSWRR